MRRAGLLVLLSVVAAQAHAAGCGVVALPLVFGIYDTLSTVPRDAVSSIEVRCTTALGEPAQVGYTVRLGDPAGVRRLQGTASSLAFQVYVDAARAQPWGDGGSNGPGAAGSITTSAPLVPATRTHSVYGRIAPQQIVSPGLYSGTLLVTIDY